MPYSWHLKRWTRKTGGHHRALHDLPSPIATPVARDAGGSRAPIAARPTDHLRCYDLRDRSARGKGHGRETRAKKNIFRNEAMCNSYFNPEIGNAVTH